MIHSLEIIRSIRTVFGRLHRIRDSPQKIRIRIGRYIINDKTIPVAGMYDRAKIVCESIRGNFDTYIAVYNDTMRDNLVHEQKIVSEMEGALQNGEFEPWFQPQYNHSTGALIGAEALVRWNKNGTYISPAEFVPIFEQNGFIYEMDKSIWEQVCKLLRKWIDEGLSPLPISVNISRKDIYHKHFIQTITDLIEKYSIPTELLRLEVTESSFSESTKVIVSKVAKDINFRYICCSKTFATLLGLKSEQEVVGKTDYELFPKEIADMFRNDDSALFATQKPQIDIQEMIPSPDGTKHYIRTSKHLMRSDTDTVIGIYCIGREVTEIREAYAQLRLLNDSLPGGIATFRCSPDNLETLYINDGICKLAGYTREEYDANPIPLFNLIFEQDRGIVTEQLKRVQNGEKDFYFIVRIHTKDGGYKWVNAVTTVSDNLGDVYIVNAVLTDVTEQQEEKERLRLAEEEYRIATEHSARTICRYNIPGRSLKITYEVAARNALPIVMSGVPYAQVEDGSISSDTAQKYIEFYEKIHHGEKENACVFCIKLNKKWRWLSARSSSVFGNSGEPLSAIVSFVDITEAQEKELDIRNGSSRSLKGRLNILRSTVVTLIKALLMTRRKVLYSGLS